MKKHIAVVVIFAALVSACAGVRGVPIFTNERLPSGGLAISVAVADKDARAEGERAGVGQFASRLKSELETALSQGGFVVLPADAPKVEATLKVTMSGALGADEELHRLEMELKFECDPDLAMEVIAELERSPEVTSVPRVVLRKSTEGRRVQATISVEAWSIQKRASAEGA